MKYVHQYVQYVHAMVHNGGAVSTYLFFSSVPSFSISIYIRTYISSAVRTHVST